jgi:hypothetical protein
MYYLLTLGWIKICSLRVSKQVEVLNGWSVCVGNGRLAIRMVTQRGWVHAGFTLCGNYCEVHFTHDYSYNYFKWIKKYSIEVENNISQIRGTSLPTSSLSQSGCTGTPRHWSRLAPSIQHRAWQSVNNCPTFWTWNQFKIIFSLHKI